MKFVTREVLINDDDSKVDVKTENEFYKLMTVFKESRVIGRWSPCSDAAAARMALAVLNNYTITPIKETKGGK